MSRRSTLFSSAGATVLCAYMAACGGGGSAGTPPEPCHAALRVLALGDSTMRGTGDMIQRELDRTLGAGAAIVQNRGENGATSADLLAGTRRTPPLAAMLADFEPDVVVVNSGMGDMRDQLGVPGYEQRLRTISATVGERLVFQTPNPVTNATPYGSDRAVAELPGYVQAMRRVAGGTVLSDVNAYVQTLPGWQALMKDGIHPGPDLHQLIVSGATVPAILAKRAQVCGAPA